MSDKIELKRHIRQGSVWTITVTETNDNGQRENFTGYGAWVTLTRSGQTAPAVTLTAPDSITLGGTLGTAVFRLGATATAALEPGPYDVTFALVPGGVADDTLVRWVAQAIVDSVVRPAA